MKRVTTFIALVFCCQFVFAQNSMIDISGVNINSGSFFLDYLRDEKSADLFKPDLYAGVEGSPFASDQWAYARIKLDDNRRFDSVLLKINLYEKKVHFKDQNGNEKMIGADVREIEIRDMSSKLNGTFYVSGYGDDKSEFYQVVSDGKKAALVKKLTTIIKETKVFNAPNLRSFELQDRFYVYSKGTLYEANKNCSSVMLAFANDSKIAKYASTNDLKCNKEKDLKALVEQYNSY
jgi:hypothetical protein